MIAALTGTGEFLAFNSSTEALQIGSQVVLRLLPGPGKKESNPFRANLSCAWATEATPVAACLDSSRISPTSLFRLETSHSGLPTSTATIRIRTSSLAHTGSSDREALIGAGAIMFARRPASARYSRRKVSIKGERQDSRAIRRGAVAEATTRQPSFTGPWQARAPRSKDDARRVVFRVSNCNEARLHTPHSSSRNRGHFRS